MTNDSWQAHVDRALAEKCIGDLLLLADEAPQADLRNALLLRAAQMLHAGGHRDLANDLRQRAAARGIDAAPADASKLSDVEPPRQVLLFSGHMIDAPDRGAPRFPIDKVPQAAQRIAETLDHIGADSRDIAYTQGACGGDLLFTEACLRRGVRVFWLQPFDEPQFLDASVNVCGGDWQRRYVDARKDLAAPPRSAPQALGAAPSGKGRSYAYERCNAWLLYTALAQGPEKLHLICLWNGEAAEGAGGTGHMIDLVRQRRGRVHWIDTRTL